ncbi:ribosome small subunit-dependent GTPase A [Alkalibaculum bacchi]|uniref:ribosome small subunit-dependent GTPase A n=1 Tax=Alkalibaculum bacchi TaxID=645887 RepID=UPI0026F2771A|nr:ribosome small subunit-dependent GTPase A [Alkalibaculum bacchi]
MNGIIIKGIGGFYYVKSEEKIYECKARGIFRKDKHKPYIGDYVEITIDQNEKGAIEEIYPRKNVLIRPPISNITQNIVVSAVVQPAINLHFVNNILVYSEHLDIKNVLCFNKSELINEEQKEEIREHFINTNYKILFTSVKEQTGLQELKDMLRGNINVFSGASGVGKSSLLNSLMPQNKAETGEISSKIERGKHTTRHVELFELEENTYIADTPGFSNINGAQEIELEELMESFPEFSDLLGQCKFNSCVHDREPNCAIKEAVENGEIASSRYSSYIEMLHSIKATKKY